MRGRIARRRDDRSRDRRRFRPGTLMTGAAMINDSPQILVAIDGSPPANWAVDVGADLAKRLAGSVTLVHVVIPPTIGAGEGALLIADIDDGLRAEGETLLT